MVRTQKAGIYDEVMDGEHLGCDRDRVAEAAWRGWLLKINRSRNCNAGGCRRPPG